MHAHELDNLTAHPSATARGVATVIAQRPDGSVRVNLHDHEQGAKRAVSCLFEPGVGDRVWVVGEAGQGYYVLAVLERASQGPARLRVDGDASLTAGGVLELSGDEGVTLSTPKALALTADELEVQARSARLTFVELAAIAKSVFASLARVTRVGRVLDLLVDKVTQRSKHSFRAIEGVDHTQATHIELEATDNAHVDARHVLVNGEQLVKMDGAQIHLG